MMVAIIWFLSLIFSTFTFTTLILAYCSEMNLWCFPMLLINVLRFETQQIKWTLYTVVLQDDQFWLVFQRRYKKLAELKRDEESASQRVRERTLYQQNLLKTKTSTQTPSTHLSSSAETPTFISHIR